MPTKRSQEKPTDVVGSMKARVSELLWLLKIQKIHMWSFEFLSKDVQSPWELFFDVKIGED